MYTLVSTKQDIDNFMSKHFSEYENYSNISEKSLLYIRKQLEKAPIHTETINAFMVSKGYNRINYMKIYRVPNIGNFYIKEKNIDEYSGNLCVESFPYVTISLNESLEKISVGDYKFYTVNQLKNVFENLINDNNKESLINILKQSKNKICITGIQGIKDVFILGAAGLSPYYVAGKFTSAKLEEKSILVTPFGCKNIPGQMIVNNNNIYRNLENIFNIKLESFSSSENILSKVAENIFSLEMDR